MAASVALSPQDELADASLSLGRVTKLFDWEKPPTGAAGRRYDMSPLDGRFLMIKSADGANGAIPISVVLNWLEALKRLAPIK